MAFGGSLYYTLTLLANRHGKESGRIGFSAQLTIHFSEKTLAATNEFGQSLSRQQSASEQSQVDELTYQLVVLSIFGQLIVDTAFGFGLFDGVVLLGFLRGNRDFLRFLPFFLIEQLGLFRFQLGDFRSKLCERRLYRFFLTG